MNAASLVFSLLVCISVGLYGSRAIAQDVPEGCPCTNNAPPPPFSCEEQATFGKCDRAGMIDERFCEFTCGRCSCAVQEPGGCAECPDIPPDDQFTCLQQVQMDKCSRPWMQGYCLLSCRQCSCSQPSSEVQEDRNADSTVVLDQQASGNSSLDTAESDPSEEASTNPANPRSCRTVWDILRDNSGLSTMKRLIKKAAFVPVVDDPNLAVTFLAPTDDALKEFEGKLGDADLMEDPRFLQKLFDYHTSIPARSLEDLNPGDVLTTLASIMGNELSLAVGESTRDDSPVSIKAYANSANFVETDITACQSVVHTIDAALVSEEVSNLLKSEPVPIKSTSTGDPEDFGARELPEGILKVISEVRKAEDAKLPDPNTINTAPGCDTIWRVVEQRSELSSLKDALEKANLFSLVSKPNMGGTFFAPNNGAFKEFMKRMGRRGDQLLMDADFLEKLLSYHAAIPAVFEDEIQPGDKLHTLAGLEDDGAFLTVGQSSFDSNGITVDGFAGRANIVEKDIAACDSVVHTIDRILIPKEISNKMRLMESRRDDRDVQDVEELLDESVGFMQPQIADDSNLPDEVLRALADLESSGVVEERDRSTVNTAPGCNTVWRAIELQPELSSLSDALGKANLFDVVSNSDLTATVFAPSDAAFKEFMKRLGRKGDELLSDPVFLLKLLTYHVAVPALSEEGMKPGEKLNTIAGLMDGSALLTVTQSDMDPAGITIEGFAGKASIVQDADIVACNSIIHVVDKVLLSPQVLFSMGAISDQPDGGDSQQASPVGGEPSENKRSQIAEASKLPSRIVTALSDNQNAKITVEAEGGVGDASSDCDTIWDVVIRHPELSALKEAFEKANFFPVVRNQNMTATFFAPTNGAFKKFMKRLGGRAESLLTDKDFLTRFLTYHVVVPALSSRTLARGDRLDTLAGLRVNGAAITVDLSDVEQGAATMQGFSGEANIVQADIRACRSIIHSVDAVLISEEVSRLLRAAN